jgi:hypothetical protein
MGVYETLFKFKDVTGLYMGSEGTHPVRSNYHRALQYLVQFN